MYVLFSYSQNFHPTFACWFGLLYFSSRQICPNRNHPYYRGSEFGRFIVHKNLVDRRTNTFRLPAYLPSGVSTVLTDPNPGNSAEQTYWTGIRDALEGRPEPDFAGVELPVYVNSEHDIFPWGRGFP
jgi:hypothetical protein